jgi:hypothetical protein
VLISLLWLRLGPPPAGLLDVESQPSLEVVDRHGERLYEARSSRGTRGLELDAARLPDRLVAATIAAEDVRFRHHPGVDPIAIARAAVHNLRRTRVLEGGSTITQQVAKLLMARQSPNGRPAHGWLAKWREAVVALRLEHRLSKQQILALYVNLAPYGNQIEGAERAARAYFGRSVSSLTPGEAAFLAALPQQPTRYNPWHDSTSARLRQQRVLSVMASHGWLTADDLTVARAETITLTRESPVLVAPHSSITSGRLPRVIHAGSRPRSMPHCSESSRASCPRTRPCSRRITPRTWRSPCSTTGPANGSRGKAPAATSTPIMAARSTASPRLVSRARRSPFTYAAAFERGFHPGVACRRALPAPTAEPGAYSRTITTDGFAARSGARAGRIRKCAGGVAGLADRRPPIARLLKRSGLTTLDNNASCGLA